ncbi:MAG: SDR family NAD(P)-dependent oxidoreductase, partial [Flavobacteriales bacterium]
MWFKGKNVWVTGASSGIGEAFVKDIAAQGANVLISARRKDKLDELAKS